MKLKTIAAGILALSILSLNATCSVDCSNGLEKFEESSYLPLVKSHLDKMIASGRDESGVLQTAMWCANIDTRTGKPLDDSHVPQRVYRLIGAPGGSTLYWDQPLVVSAILLSKITGEKKYKDAAVDYVKDFLKYCVDENGMFAWGNHQYYDISGDSLVKFHDGYHEIRPITPAWELFWQQDSAICSRYIRVMAERHIYNSQSGGFNRHDDGKAEHPFLEAGAVLVETLAWLYQKENDPYLHKLALRVAEFSYGFRGRDTGLIRNSPGSKRWDDYALTTEVGMWALSLLRAHDYTSDNKFLVMARDAVNAYLRYGYDAQSRLYYGQLNTENGTAVVPDSKGYWPGKYSDVWNKDQWPTHDYPMSLAEACLILYELTGQKVFAEGVQRWTEIVRSRKCPEGGSYAENYGRCIHFMTRAGVALNKPELLNQAAELADAAVAQLYENGMFQGLPGSHAYESVDGVGYLCLAMISLEYKNISDYMGFHF